MNNFGQDFNDYSFDECETVIKKIAKDFEEKRREAIAKLFKMPLGSEDVIPEICIHKRNIRFSYKTKVAIIEYQ